jgi:PleD family two-component response regulator
MCLMRWIDTALCIRAGQIIFTTVECISDSRHRRPLKSGANFLSEDFDMVASTLQMISSAQEISVMRLPQQLKAGNDRYVRSFDGPLLAPSDVLLYGHDLHLSDSRKILLESVGYKVRFAGNADEALLRVMRTPIQLLIVCHTVPFESAEKLLLVARTSQPVVRVLVLTAAKTNSLSTSRGGGP